MLEFRQKNGIVYNKRKGTISLQSLLDMVPLCLSEWLKPQPRFSQLRIEKFFINMAMSR